MRILFDIVHPADVLFFANPLRMLQAQGHSVLVASRRKDVTEQLLAEHRISHVPLTTAGRGIISLGRELLVRDLALVRLARRSKVDVLTGFGGVAASHAGFLLRKRSVVFYDTNTATLQNRVCYPFASEIHVPTWYDGPVPSSKTFRFRGLKEQSYLAEGYFKSDRGRAIAAGLDPESDNFLIRVVGWGASHDLGKSGWSDELLRQLVRHLSRQGKVHISSERGLPADLDAHAYAGRVSDLHDLIAHCRLIISESVTVATEACVLGVPSVFVAPFGLSNVAELRRWGLMDFVQSGEWEPMLASIEGALRLPQADWRRRHQSFLSSTIDVAKYVTEALLHKR